MKSESMLHRLFAALSHRNYRFYWLGQLSSVLALNMELAAQAWLVFLLTDSPLMLGMAGIVYAVPRVSLVLVGGAIADRADKRRIMVLTQSLLAVAYLVLGLLVLTERIAFWHVLVFVFNSGFLRAFDRPSRYALLPEMVPREELANAVALGSSVWQACRLVGPGLAGVLILLARHRSHLHGLFRQLRGGGGAVGVHPHPRRCRAGRGRRVAQTSSPGSTSCAGTSSSTACWASRSSTASSACPSSS